MSLKNPILNDKYSSLIASQDPIAKQIVKNVTDIYNNLVIFNSSNDILTFDNSIVNIQNTFNKLIDIATECASISNRLPNCSSTPSCKFVNYIEDLYLDIFILTTTVIENKGKKEQYGFLPFFMTLYMSNMVTSNPNNQNKFELPKVKYYLCSSSYEPVGASSSKTDQYNEFLDRMKVKQTTVVDRQSSTNSINILLHILLPTVIFIILILLYVQYVRKAKASEETLNDALSSIKKNK